MFTSAFQVNMLPLVCNDAVAILFMFDLSRKSTLNSIKEWYRQARGFNKVCSSSQERRHQQLGKLILENFRLQFPSWLERNTIISQPSRQTNKKRSPDK